MSVRTILLWSPAKTKVETYTVLVALIGIWWLVQGIVDIVGSFHDHSIWGRKLFIGLVSIMASGYVLMYTIAVSVALTKIFVLVLGLWDLTHRIIMLLMAFQDGGWALASWAFWHHLRLTLMANYILPGLGLTMLWTAGIFAFFGRLVMIMEIFRPAVVMG